MNNNFMSRMPGWRVLRDPFGHPVYVYEDAVSKVIVSIKDDLDLPTARHMKSDTARESYRERALRIHKIRKDKLCKTPTYNSFNRLSTLKSALMQNLVPAS